MDVVRLQNYSSFASAVGYAENKTLAIPVGETTVGARVALPSGITIEGAGWDSILRVGGQYITAQSKQNITLRNLAIKANGASAFQLLFTLCQNVTIDHCSIDGRITNAVYLGGELLRFDGCRGINVLQSDFYDFNDGVYLSNSGATKCDDVVVRDSRFMHRAHGNFYSYPVGVYQHECHRLRVINCSGLNILPGNLNVPSPVSYLVYEGDGACLDTEIVGCTSVIDEDVARVHIGVYTSTVRRVLIDQMRMICKATQPSATLCAANARETVHVARCEGDRSTLRVCDVANAEMALVENNIMRGSRAYGYQVGGNTNFGPRNVLVRDNLSDTSHYSGIFVNVCREYFHVERNRVFDANTSNTRHSAGNNEYLVAGIAAYGPTRGRVSQNYVENRLGGPGHAQFGFATPIARGVHSIDVKPDNEFVRMRVAPKFNA